jgi:hypothetical protein
VDILNCLYGYTNLNINIRAELLEEVRVIWNDPVVVTDDLLVWEAWSADRKYTAVIPAPVLGIPVLADNHYSRKRLREPLLACERGGRRFTDYIRGFRVIVQATQPVRHLASNNGCEFARRIPRWVRELGIHHLVNQIRG